jgi:hypothetical protein
MPDFVAAANTLGITEEELINALGDIHGVPDFATSAKTLRITEEELVEAMGVSEPMEKANNGSMGNKPNNMSADAGAQQGRAPQGNIDLAAAVIKLGITEEVLMNAIGKPGQGTPDFASAAKVLGTTEAELLEAWVFSEQNMPHR